MYLCSRCQQHFRHREPYLDHVEDCKPDYRFPDYDEEYFQAWIFDGPGQHHGPVVH